MPNICRLGPDGKYAGNINQKYFVLANILYIPVACTAVLAKLVVMLFCYLSVLESICCIPAPKYEFYEPNGS